MDNSKPPGIRMGQIFVARALFEHTRNPTELPPNTPVGELPTTVQVAAGVDQEEKTGFVSVTVATTPESSGLYRFLIQMIGIMEVVPGAENLNLQEYVRNWGPSTLYPFVREALANLTGRGRFGPVWLQPMNLTPFREGLAKAAADDKAPPAGQA